MSSAATSLLPCRWPGETCHREAGVTCPRLEPWPSPSLPPPRLQQSQTHNNKASCQRYGPNGPPLEADQQLGVCKAHPYLPRPHAQKQAGWSSPLTTTHPGTCNGPGAARTPLTVAELAGQTHRTWVPPLNPTFGSSQTRNPPLGLHSTRTSSPFV